MRQFNVFAAAILAVGLARGAVEAQTAGRSVWEGIYNTEQAARGEAQYHAHCGACHGATLNGTDEAPGLSGGEFISHYEKLTIADLFDRVRTTMPQNDPGSMSRDEYADVVAFLLKANGFPAGNAPIDHRAEVMATISIEAQRPAATVHSGK